MAEKRVAQSFNETEIKMLDMLIRSFMMGNDVRIIIRKPEFKHLARKIQAMREKSELAQLGVEIAGGIEEAKN